MTRFGVATHEILQNTAIQIDNWVFSSALFSEILIFQLPTKFTRQSLQAPASPVSYLRQSVLAYGSRITIFSTIQPSNKQVLKARRMEARRKKLFFVTSDSDNRGLPQTDDKR